MREMGDVVRIGDSKLWHLRQLYGSQTEADSNCTGSPYACCCNAPGRPMRPTIRDWQLMYAQMEIIKSLQMAAQHETAILNLRLLHEASITNRKDTFVILDEMKQRIAMTRPIPRQIESGSPLSSWPNGFKPVDRAPEGYVPSAVTLPPQGETKESKSGLARYFQMKRNSTASSQSASTSTCTPTEPININYSAAFEQLVRTRGEDRATIMKDIDEILVSYKGLDVNSRAPEDPWMYNQHSGPAFRERQGTLDMLNAHSPQGEELYGQEWCPAPSSNPPMPQAYANQYPTFNQDMFNGHSQQSPYAATDSYPLRRTHMEHRFSNSSTSSAPLSDRSWERHDSESSRSSYAQSDYRYSTPSQPSSRIGVSPSTPDHYGQRLSINTSYASPDGLLSSPIAPLSVPQRNLLRASLQNGEPSKAPLSPSSPIETMSSPNVHSRLGTRAPNAIAPFSSPPQSPEPTKNGQQETGPMRPDLRSPEVHGPPSSHSGSSSNTVSQVPWHRAVSAPILDRIRQPSIASTDSSGSGSVGVLPRPVSLIPSSTIRSPQPGQERMMNGRPCKDNNYWGFCKGAWDVREETKKGLALRTMPSGMYNTKDVWECRSCNFRGNTYTVTLPGKKAKKETIVDPNIHTSKSGIRYKWIFLAKSHVKKKTPDSAGEECNYGCVICSVELKVTSIFGNVDTLMYHLLEHVSDMTQKTMLQTRCIVGRTAGTDEVWDINVPLFADVNEVEG